MVELIDNVSQFFVSMVAAISASIHYYKSRKQVYFLLTCFYGTFSIGGLYWMLYILLFGYSPQVFYVSELAWIASFMFLLTLEITISSSEERKFKHPAMWLAPLFCIPQFFLYITHGEIINNIFICGITMVVAIYAIRGLIFARRQKGRLRDMQYLYMSALVFIFLEYLLWTSSCFWISDTLTNPYFWLDFLLTGALFVILPATRKTVRP